MQDQVEAAKAYFGIGEAERPKHSDECQVDCYCDSAYGRILALALTQAREELAAAKDQRDDEAWMHAACLSIAEGVKDWDKPCHLESPAMKAVRALRSKLTQAERERDEAKARATAFFEDGAAVRADNARLRSELEGANRKVHEYEEDERLGKVPYNELQFPTRQRMREEIMRLSEWGNREHDRAGAAEKALAETDAKADRYRRQIIESETKLEAAESKLAEARSEIENYFKKWQGAEARALIAKDKADKSSRHLSDLRAAVEKWAERLNQRPLQQHPGKIAGEMFAALPALPKDSSEAAGKPTIPEREKWLYENPEALASVRQGLKEAAEGETAPLAKEAGEKPIIRMSGDPVDPADAEDDEPAPSEPRKEDK